jgi:hypothetical protein
MLKMQQHRMTTAFETTKTDCKLDQIGPFGLRTNDGRLAITIFTSVRSSSRKIISPHLRQSRRCSNTNSISGA